MSAVFAFVSNKCNVNCNAWILIRKTEYSNFLSPVRQLVDWDYRNRKSKASKGVYVLFPIWRPFLIKVVNDLVFYRYLNLYPGAEAPGYGFFFLKKQILFLHLPAMACSQKKPGLPKSSLL